MTDTGEQLDRCIARAHKALLDGDYDTYNRLGLLATELAAKLHGEIQDEQTTKTPLPTGNR